MEHHELDINKRYKNVSKTWDNEVNLKRVGNKSNENGDVFKNHHVTVDGIPILKENGYDKDPFSDFCQKIVQDEVDGYLEKRKQDVLGEFHDKLVDGGLPRKFLSLGNRCLMSEDGLKEIVENFDSSNSIEMVDHPTNMDKVFDEMEDEKHSLETNDVYDWTKNDKIKRMMEDASTMIYHINNEPKRTFLVDVDKLDSTDWDEKSKKSNLLIDCNKFERDDSDIEGLLYDENAKIIEKEILKSKPKLDEGQSWLQKSLIGIGEHATIQHPVVDVIEKSPHYNTEVFPETIVMMEDNFKIILTMGFCKLNAFKYRMRTGLKDINTIVEDVKKALNYEKRYKEFLTKMKNTFKQDKVLPIMIGDEPFEVKVEDTDDYNKAILHIKSYLEQYNAKKIN